MWWTHKLIHASSQSPAFPPARIQWRGGVGRTGEDRFEGREEKDTVKNSCEAIMWREERHAGGDRAAAAVKTLGEEFLGAWQYALHTPWNHWAPLSRKLVRNICITLGMFLEESALVIVREDWCQQKQASRGLSSTQAEFRVVWEIQVWTLDFSARVRLTSHL